VNKFLKSTWTYKSLIGIIAIILIVAIAVSANRPESQQPIQAVSINLMTADMMKNNPELAIASGVRGLIEIGYADWPESVSIFASRGERVTIPIFISFTSFDPNLKSLDVLIDPSREDIGVRRWQCWYEYDSEGKEINRGEICINDLISYDKEGIVTIEAGGRVECNMFIDIPSDLPPLETKSIMLVGAGIGKEDKEEHGIGFTDNIGGKEITLSE
jgi:hypothetical protein